MGFSADWLSLREPADHAARDAGLALQAMRVAGPAPVIVDLGSGTGSTMRAMATLKRGVIWHLVDHDAGLLSRAAAAPDDMVHTHICDLGALDALPLDAATLVTASALLDLCAEDWLRNLARRIAARGLPFYAALSYDGVMDWSITDPADAEIVAAFSTHQRGDKGFGKALGPDAAPAAARIFGDLGYVTHVADSPWRLGPAQADLQRDFIEGVGQAAAEAGSPAARDWVARRQAQIAEARCHIGHQDILALPPHLAARAQGAT